MCLICFIVIYICCIFAQNKAAMIEESIIPYSLPEEQNHSFFFIDQHIHYELEAKLHKHDAWEIYYVVRGKGIRVAGDTTMTFSEGDALIIPPGMHHRWKYDPASADGNGFIHYLMVAFSHSFIMRCMEDFPELRNALYGISFPTEALKFGREAARSIGSVLSRMNEMSDIRRLCEMFSLLPAVFRETDYIPAGKPIRIEKDVRRMQHITEYVMAHYIHNITLDDIAQEMGMNRSAFCSYFRKQKGMTFTQFVTKYRLDTACGILKNSNKQVSEICYTVGFNDVPHFVRLFTAEYGMSPTKYRKRHK